MQSASVLSEVAAQVRHPSLACAENEPETPDVDDMARVGAAIQSLEALQVIA
jgi:hypothetical protein